MDVLARTAIVDVLSSRSGNIPFMAKIGLWIKPITVNRNPGLLDLVQHI